MVLALFKNDNNDDDNDDDDDDDDDDDGRHYKSLKELSNLKKKWKITQPVGGFDLNSVLP